MSKRIPLTQGKFAIVDDEDFEWLMQWKWCAHRCYYVEKYYAVRSFKGKTIRMHREILKLSVEEACDHRDGNSLNNKKCNLRKATQQQNLQNRKPRKNCSSQYKGVNWDKQHKKWRTRIVHNGQQICLGFSNDEIEAAKMYDKAAKTFFQEFAYLNFKE